MTKAFSSMRVRPTARDNKSSKLKSLKCFNEAYERLCSGWPVSEVARFIQQERGELKDLRTTQVEFMLKDFRKTIPAGDLVAKRFPKDFANAKEKLEQSLDELVELEELYRLQMRRIGIDFGTEQKINKLLPSMTGEIREARQLLETIAQVKLDLGIHTRAPTEHNVSVNGTVEARLADDLSGYSPAVAKVMDNAESRRRVQGLVDRFLKIEDKRLPSASSREDEDEDEA